MVSPNTSSALTPESQKAEIDRLRKKNEWCDALTPKWAFYLAAYEGGDDFLTRGNIFKHFRENEADYQDRIQRAHNLNYCEPLVDFFTNFIFSEAIDRSGGANSDFYNDFIKNVNLKGDGVDAFMRQVSDDMQIFGMVYILTDAPRLNLDPERPITKADEIANNIRPYWVLIKPDEVLDWAEDDFGKYTYLKRCQIVYDVVSGKGTRKLEKYTEFYSDVVSVTLVDVTRLNDPEIVDSYVLDNPVGFIPITVARYKRSKKYPQIGLSFLRDFARNNREITNLTSLLQEFLYRQAFNILVRESDGSGIPMKGQEDGLIGAGNVIDYPKGGKAPEYIYPPAEPAKFIQDERQRIKNEMFVRAAQDAFSEIFNGEQASGFSQAQSFSRTVPFISSRADELERVENELMRLVFALMGKDWDGKIKYKDRYELTNLTDAITQFLSLARDLQLPSETFVKAELKRLVHEYDGKLPSEVIAKIDKEIDDMGFEKWQEVQKEALVGKGSSPGEQQKPKGTGTMAEVKAEAGMPAVGATKKIKSK